jgi:hypothetical protein
VSSSDQFTYEASSFPDTTSEPFVQKKVVYTQDEQNGSYSGVVSFTLESVANSGTFAEWSNSYTTLPFVVAARCTADVRATTNPRTVGLKNGFHQLTHSVAVTWNGQTLVQQSNYLNSFVSFRLVTEVSGDDVEKNGPSWGFYPDTADSFKWSANRAPCDGPGYSNNRVFQNRSNYATPGYKGSTFNTGLSQRTSYVLDNSTTGRATGNTVTTESVRSRGGIGFFTDRRRRRHSCLQLALPGKNQAFVAPRPV